MPLFIFHHHISPIYLMVYVDNIVLIGPDAHSLDDFVKQLARKFALKDLGSLSYFLGVEVLPTMQGFSLSKRKYIIDLLERTKMTGAKPVPTPMIKDSTLSLYSIIDNLTDYMAAVGSLQYLTLTRPDAAFAVNKLSQFMHQPCSTRWATLKRLLRYLSGTLDKGITIYKDSPLNLHAYSDAGWGMNKDDFTSTMGQVVLLGRTAISWSSKKQRFAAQSSTKAEYKAVSNTAGELLWLRNLLQEPGITLPHQPVIYCDNMGATQLSANPVFHSRMKHLALA